VCHGWAGEIELLLVAASLLDDPAHLAAARAAGLACVARARAGRGYGSGLWDGAHTPALLHGPPAPGSRSCASTTRAAPPAPRSRRASEPARRPLSRPGAAGRGACSRA
jgi:hypothetical protein